MPEEIKETEIEPGISDYIFIICKRRWVILGVFLAIFIFNLLYTNIQTPIYQATARVRILERKTVATLLTDWFAWVPGDPIASQAKVIESYPVLERVVKELGLVSRDATTQELMRAVASLQNRIKAIPIKETNIIKITVEDTNRERVALIANKIAESYIEENVKEKAKQARTVREFIQEQLNEVSNKLETSEEALKEFRQSGQATGIAISLQNRLAELETERAKLLRIYTELHPDVIRLNEEIDIVKERIRQMPEVELEFARLSREVEVNEKSYKGLQEKFEDARIAEVEKVPDVTLVNPASVPTKPVRPNKAANTILGIFAGLVLSIAAGFGVEQLDTSIGTIEDVEKYLRLPVLGVIP